MFLPLKLLMASRIAFFFVLTFLLLLVTRPFNVYSEDSKPRGQAFDFLQRLKGCHKGQTVKGLGELKCYLRRFGYLNYDNSKGKNASHIKENEFDDLLDLAVKAYQANFHLKVSGILDADTIKQMMRPRCGVADSVNNKISMSPNRTTEQSKIFHLVSYYSFLEGNPRWPRSHLTYRFNSSAPVFPPKTMKNVLSQAFKRWQRVTHFTFRKVSGKGRRADIVIGFHRGVHGPCAPFTGTWGSVAHATAPTDGKLHFNADQSWSTNPERYEIDFETVAVHEIGHLLGLGHSFVEEAIMYPNYPGHIRRDLHSDDIEGIRALYNLR